LKSSIIYKLNAETGSSGIRIFAVLEDPHPTPLPEGEGARHFRPKLFPSYEDPIRAMGFGDDPDQAIVSAPSLFSRRIRTRSGSLSLWERGGVRVENLRALEMAAGSGSQRTKIEGRAC